MSTSTRTPNGTRVRNIGVRVRRCWECGHRSRTKLTHMGVVFDGHCPHHPQAEQVEWTLHHELAERALRLKATDLIANMSQEIVEAVINCRGRWA